MSLSRCKDGGTAYRKDTSGGCVLRILRQETPLVVRSCTLKLSRFLTILFLLVCGAARSRAQTTPDAPAEQSVSPGADSTADAPTAQTVQTTTNPPPKAPATQKTGRASNEHNFWDKENDWLFAGVAAARTLDYFSTLNMRRRGRQEILLTDAVVDDHPAFAVIEAATTGASIGLSYAFHYYGHHKLERWTSVVHIGLATTGSVRNYSLKTFHYRTAP